MSFKGRIRNPFSRKGSKSPAATVSNTDYSNDYQQQGTTYPWNSNDGQPYQGHGQQQLHSWHSQQQSYDQGQYHQQPVASQYLQPPTGQHDQTFDSPQEQVGYNYNQQHFSHNAFPPASPASSYSSRPLSPYQAYGNPYSGVNSAIPSATSDKSFYVVPIYSEIAGISAFDVELCSRLGVKGLRGEKGLQARKTLLALKTMAREQGAIYDSEATKDRASMKSQLRKRGYQGLSYDEKVQARNRWPRHTEAGRLEEMIKDIDHAAVSEAFATRWRDRWHDMCSRTVRKSNSESAPDDAKLAIMSRNVWFVRPESVVAIDISNPPAWFPDGTEMEVKKHDDDQTKEWKKCYWDLNYNLVWN